MKLKELFIVGAGSALEIYDSYVFSFIMSQITYSLFPSQLHTNIIGIASFSVLFIVRPFGGFFWGIIGDKMGKTIVFKHAILFMALSTLCIGLIPNYSYIGWTAPLLLIIFRAIQGFSISGEFGSAIVLCYEQSLPKQRFKRNGLIYVFIFCGILAANLIIYLINHANIPRSISWRIPFILGGILGVSLYIIRKKLKINEIKFKEVNFKMVMSNYKILLVTVCAIFLINLNWLYFSSINLIMGEHFDKNYINKIGVIFSGVTILSSFIFGYLFSFLKEKTTKIILIASIFFTYVFFILNKSYSNIDLQIFYFFESIFAGIVFASLPILIIDALNYKLHNSIYNVANNISTTIIVGLFPFLINYLRINFATNWLHNFFIINLIISVVSIVSIGFLKRYA